MTDQRDALIMQVVVKLAESSPEAPTFEDLESLSDPRTDDGPVRLIHQTGPPPRIARTGLVALVVAAGVLVIFGAVAVLFQAGEPATPAVTPEIDGVVSYTWHQVAHDDAAFGDRNQWMSSVTKGGPGLVAVGSAGVWANAGVWTSADGIAWSRVPHDEAVFGGASMLSVAAGGPGLVAVGSVGGLLELVANPIETAAAVWISADGITWSRVPHDEAIFGGVEDQVMNSVVVGGPGLVAVGSDGSAAAVWTSVDGISWSRVPHDEAIFGGVEDQVMNSVVVGGPGLVAVGSAVWTSVDGHAWSPVPENAQVFGGEGDQMALSVTAGGPGLVAVGLDRPAADDEDVFRGTVESSAAVWTSVDGITWHRVAHDQAVFGSDTGAGVGMNSVIVGGPGLVAVGGVGAPPDESWRIVRSEALVWTSIDGVTWSRGTSVGDAIDLGAGGAVMSGVTTGGPGLVAVGSVDASVGIYGGVWVAVSNG